ncbi:hypothetical protein JTB14_003435 [Gonioctena quinquepunctata]|nr:hypothetical protein JTB14_003435 [Gonioctena quinquepunctata]
MVLLDEDVILQDLSLIYEEHKGNYLNPAEYASLFNNMPNKVLNIMHCNIRSIRKNFNEFLAMYETYALYSCDIFILNSYIKGNRLYVNGRIYTPKDLENQEDIGNNLQEKPQSAPGTPIQIETRELQRLITKPPEPSAKNPHQKINTPTQLVGKFPKEVGEKQKIRTRSGTGK